MATQMNPPLQPPAQPIFSPVLVSMHIPFLKAKASRHHAVSVTNSVVLYVWKILKDIRVSLTLTVINNLYSLRTILVRIEVCLLNVALNWCRGLA